MADIKKTISLEYQAKGLESILKTFKDLEKIELIGKDDRDNIKKLRNDAEELMKTFSSSGGQIVDPREAEKSIAKFEAIVERAQDIRAKAFEAVNPLAEGNISFQQKRIRQLEKEITAYERKPDGTFSSPTKAIRESHLKKLVSTEEGGDNILENKSMVSNLGNKMTNPVNFLSTMEKISEVLQKTDGIESSILEKLEKGEELTKEEETSLNLALEKAREKYTIETQNSEKISLNATELNEQYKNRNTILKEEQERLQSIHEEKIEYLKAEIRAQKELLAEDQEEAIQDSLNIIKDKDPEKRTEAEKKLLEANNLLAESEKNLENLTRQNIIMKKRAAEASHELTKKEKEEKKGKDALRGSQDKVNSTVSQAAKQVLGYGLVLTAIRKIYRETIKTIKDLDQALTEMAIVTSMNREQTWNLLSTFQDLATQTGFTTTEIAKLSTVYFRQGKSLTDVIKLTTAAAKAARVAGISAEESANYLTSAVNGFGLAADQALAVSDRFAALAASSASSYEELATGLSKFAAQANIAGMSIDFALGMLAKGVETTREAPETIGTALKTVISRMRELTDLGKTLDDGMDVNRVDKALGQIGIRLMGTNGQFRDMQDVLTDVGMAWSTLNTNQQASVAVALAGTRQQSRLIAIMNDFPRTLELVQTAEESAGATNAQHMEYMNSMAAAMTGLQTAWQKFITTITESEIIIGVVRTLTSTVEFFSKVLNSLGLVGKNAMIAIGGLVLALNAKNIQTKIGIALGITSEGQYSRLTAAYWKNIWAAITMKKSEDALNKTKSKGLIGWLAKIIALRHIRRNTLEVTGANVGLAASEKVLNTTVVEGTFAWSAYWIAATAGIALILVGVAAVIAVIVKLYKKHKELSKSVEEVKNEYSALNYELNKTNKSMKSVIEKYDELSKKSIKTDEDREALAELQSEIENFGKDKEFVVYKMSGEIDWDSSIAKMNEAIKNNELEIRENWETVLGHAIYRATIEGMTKAITGEVSNFVAQDFISSIESEYDPSSEEAIELFLEPKISELSDKELKKINKLKNNFEKALELKKMFGPQIEEFFEMYSEKVEDFKEADTFYKQFQVWDDIKDKSQDLKNVFKTIFKGETDLFEAVGDNEQIYNLVEGLKFGFSDAAEMINILILEEKDLEKTFKKINKEIEELMDGGYSEIEARNIAILQMADSVEDAENKMKLYKIASSKDSLRLAQDLETTTNTLKNFDKMQKKYLSGDTTVSELQAFLDKHKDLMLEGDFWEDFSSGASLAKYKADELKENYDEIIAAVTTIDKQIQDIDKEMEEANEEDLKSLNIKRKGLEVQKEIHLALVRYHGELADGGHLLSNYNNLLENYNRLLKYGVDQIELLNAAKKASAEYTASELGRVKELIKAHMDESEAYSKLVKIVNGTPILEDDWANSLDSSKLGKFNTWFNELKELYDEEEKIAEEYIDSNIKQEQELIDKKIKIYEDYFKALDKLEDARERKQSREDITKQLQRLSGATDEASRKKAKDLRAELIKLDEQSKKDERKESRDALIEGLKLEKKAISTMWGELIEDFVDTGTTVGRTIGEAMGLAIEKQWNTANPDNPIKLVPRKTKITDSGNVGQTSGSKTVVHAKYEKYATQRNPDYGSLAGDLTASDLRSNGIDPSSYMMYAWQKGYTKISPREHDEALERDGVSAWDSMEVDREGVENYLLDQDRGFDYAFSTITEIDKTKKNQAYEELFDLLLQSTSDILENYDIKKFRSLIKNPEEIVANSDISNIQKNLKKATNADGWYDLAEKFGGTWRRPGLWETLSSPTPYTKAMDEYRRLTREAGYKRGGIVDYTGPAMVHGSKTQPEAFLNAKQTELFANLRDILQKVNVDSNSSSGFVIENITIQTQELNKNQDFKKAGRTLADEFASAIKSRGLNLNVKR